MPADWEEAAIVLAEELVASKVAAVVTGGASRGESVRAALAEVPDDALVVLVHDAARPLVDDAMIERVLAPLAEGYDGVVPGLALSDTVKRVEGRRRSRDRRSLGARDRANAAGVHGDGAPERVSRRRSCRCDGLRDSRRGGRRAHPRRRRRSAASEDHDGGRSRARRVVALKAVFFDLGETLVDEERWWRVLAERAGLQPHVVWAALGVTIERGEDHNLLWSHLGIERPPTWFADIPYELDDLYPDALACLEAVAALGLLVGIVGNQPAAMERWARAAALPAVVISSSESLGVKKPDPRFFECIVELAGCDAGEWRTSAIVSRTTSSLPLRQASSRSTSAVGRGAGCNELPRRPRSASTTSRRCPRR